MSSIIQANETNISSALLLLEQANLPTNDLGKEPQLFIIQEEEVTVATIGLEVYENIGLLRSLAVKEEKRNAGLGDQLVLFLEDYARKKGLKQLILLTTTADKYFNKKGYQRIHRNDVPEPIKKSFEFSSVCPSSAIIMKKDLA